MLHSSELAWLTGMVEGEGCFCMANKKDRNSIHCSFNITNTDHALIQKCKEIINKEIGIELSEVRHIVLKGHYKPIWRLWIEKHESLKKFIDAIYPYLVGEKKLHASIMLQFVERRIALRGSNYKAPKYSADDWKLYEAMKVIKNTKESVETIRSASQVDEDIVRANDISKTLELSGNRIARLN